ncbi:hypothetical protein [Paenibacillus pini]|nr:hypothetical protein [Paenibacillus pini]
MKKALALVVVLGIIIFSNISLPGHAGVNPGITPLNHGQEY